MYYIYISDNLVRESILEVSPDFPSVPIEKRYTPEFLAQCVKSETAQPNGWVYDPDTQTFSEPPPLPEPEPLPEPAPAPEPTAGLQAQMAALAVPLAVMLGLDISEAERDNAVAAILPLAAEPEPDGVNWAPGKYYAADKGIKGTDGIKYLVNRDHISDNEHLPQAPSGATRYRKEGATPPPVTVIEWQIGSPAKNEQIIHYTDGKYYNVLKDHTMGWSATPGGYDPEGYYGPGRNEA